MRWAMLLMGVQALLAEVRVEPAAPKQGQTIRVTASDGAAAARFNRRVITLYPQASGARFGLMPVAANDKPGVSRLEVMDANGGVIESADITVGNARFAKQNIRLSRGARSLKPSPDEMEAVSAFRKTVSAARHWREPLALPVPGCLTSPYGVRRFHNGKPTGNYHAGIDQASPTGTPIHAIADGIVRLVRAYNIHGNVVGVDHGQGLSSIYLHMSKFESVEGQAVRKGDTIGYAGSTGRATGTHLHWSLYANGIAVDPTQWIAPPPCVKHP